MDLIRIENFKKSFDKKVVHQGINVSVKKGECLGLIGGSGVGKSIILKSLIGLIKPDSGKIFIGDEEITDYSEDELIDIRKRVAYVFQNGALFDSMSVYDNLAYPLREHTDLKEKSIKKRVLDLLEEFSLSGNENILPAELSGGMQKRVGLARSIILNPEVVLYDEPTAGLDPHNTIKIQEMIIQLKNKGVTSIFVTHDMPSALAVCDRMAIIVKGKIEAVGSTKEMQTDSDSLFYKFMQGKES